MPWLKSILSFYNTDSTDRIKEKHLFDSLKDFIPVGRLWHEGKITAQIPFIGKCSQRPFKLAKICGQ